MNACHCQYCCCVQEEKRYFQMELVNRETNFNKVFNSDPKVGFLNPLTASKVSTAAWLFYHSFIFYLIFHVFLCRSHQMWTWHLAGQRVPWRVPCVLYQLWAGSHLAEYFFKTVQYWREPAILCRLTFKVWCWCCLLSAPPTRCLVSYVISGMFSMHRVFIHFLGW